MTIKIMLKLSLIGFVAIIALTKSFISLNAVSALEFVAVTVATEENDAINRYKKSAESFNITYEIFGMGQVWEGGDLSSKPGGGQKVNIIKEGLVKYADNDDLIVMFTDSYDVVFQNSSEIIIKKFKESGAKVLFSAEGFCWPNKSLKDSYPLVGDNEKRFLNSGGFIGYASSLYKVVSHKSVHNEDDDQLYYTEIFLNETLRDEYQMKLDTRSEIFQNLNGALDEVVLLFDDKVGYLQNTISGATPIVIHANGPIKNEFNSLTNYIGYSWHPTVGCQQCKPDQVALESRENSDLPRVTLALLIPHATPFMDEYFERIERLSYSKSKMDVLIYCLTDLHLDKCTNFVSRNTKKYSSIKLVDSKDIPEEAEARRSVLATASELDNDFLLVVDSVVQLTKEDTIEELVSLNRSMVAPLVKRREQLWSNFWGALSSGGYYARSNDYIDIVNFVKKGLWNVPYVNSVYMVAKRALARLVLADQVADMDTALCEAARRANVFMYVDNRHEYGHQVVVSEEHTTSHLHNDLWEVFSNPLDWQDKYIHPLYLEQANYTLAETKQPCTDVFWFPLVSKTFCKHMIEEMEHFGQWSNGANEDTRLEGGYESVPTRDIHMRQVDWEPHWLHVLAKYVYPLQRRVFAGYEDLPRARMNFVVRYKPDEQPVLRPHQDASSYSLNVALNVPGSDYEGGGTRFLRYDCEVRQSELGWVLMHPGRITHQHEGLRTTKGTRYIFVTFVNP